MYERHNASTVRVSRPPFLALILLEGSQGSLNALSLRWRDEATQHLDKMRMLRPGKNVLPPVRFEYPSMQSLPLRLAQGASTRGSTIVGIGLGLGLEYAIDSSNQLNKFFNGLIPLRGC
jgi:hypothetical protein